MGDANSDCRGTARDEPKKESTEDNGEISIQLLAEKVEKLNEIYADLHHGHRVFLRIEGTEEVGVYRDNGQYQCQYHSYHGDMDRLTTPGGRDPKGIQKLFDELQSYAKRRVLKKRMEIGQLRSEITKLAEATGLELDEDDDNA